LSQKPSRHFSLNDYIIWSPLLLRMVDNFNLSTLGNMESEHLIYKGDHAIMIGDIDGVGVIDGADGDL
jgi:hypothetical protein